MTELATLDFKRQIDRDGVPRAALGLQVDQQGRGNLVESGVVDVTLGADPAVAAGSAIAVVTAMTMSAMSVRRFTPSPRLPLSRLPSRATR